MNLGEWQRRISYLFNRRKIEAELVREMQSHREMLSEATGQRARFGNTLKLREESQDVWGWSWLDAIRQDFRYAGRTLKPGFVLIAGLILSMGIGLNLTLFEVADAALVAPLRVKEPEALVNLQLKARGGSSNQVPYPVTQFVRNHNNALSAVLTRAGSTLAWGDDASDPIKVAFVSPNWFHELGYRAARGRALAEDLDQRPDAAPVVVISDALWQRRFHSDSSALGATIRLNNRTAAIVGVAPADFPDLRGDNPQAWIPIDQIDYFLPGANFKLDWTAPNTALYGRLRPGVSLISVRDQLRQVMAELSRQHPKELEAGAWLEPYSGANRFRTRPEQREIWAVLLLLTCLTGLVLVVACSNLANVVLTRALARVREFSIRSALGASRWRIVRQLLFEALIIVCIGTLGGLILSYWGARLFALATELPPYLDVSPGFRTAGAAAAMMTCSVLLVGAFPAWRVSRQDLTLAIKDGGQQVSTGMHRARVRTILIGAQVSGSCLLLVFAGLMVRGLQQLLTADPGFDFEDVAVLDPSLARNGIKGAVAREWWTSVRRTLATHPEIETLAIASHAPVGASVSESTYPDVPGLRVSSLEVEPAFFKVFKIPILLGRNFLPADDHAKTVIIGRRLALEMYGTADVIGRGFPKTQPGRFIVGVSQDARLIRMQAPNVAEQYFPLNPEGFEGYILAARARGDAARLPASMRVAARTADSRVLAGTILLRDEFAKKLRGPRLASLIAAVTGLLALAVACVGIYGVASFAAALRTKEIGIRMALGAPRAAMLRSLIRRHTPAVTVGIAIGMGAARAAGAVLQGSPFYLDSTDPSPYVVGLLIVGLTAIAATVLPAWRAIRSNPLDSLRHE